MKEETTHMSPAPESPGQHPLFTVIINNYNYGSYVGQAIQSVLNQTLEDFELIIVDDGSTDNSREMISSCSDPRIRTVFKDNGGQASALNVGVAMARGKYVAFLDSDDLFDANKLEETAKAFAANNYSLVQHTLVMINENSSPTGGVFPRLQAGVHDILPKYFKQRRTDFFAATSGITVPRRILRNMFPIPEEEWRICADAPLTRPLPLFGKICTLKQPLGSYRVHGNNNWVNTDTRRTMSLALTGKVNRYTNTFLRRWGITEQIGIPIPMDLLESRKIRSVALYGAGKHTRYLLECQGLPDGLSVAAILDDKPSVESIAGIPVLHSSQSGEVKDCDAVLVSSDTFEIQMIRKALGMGWSNVIPVYSVEHFRKNCRNHFQRLAEHLRRRQKQRIALYGAGVHSLNTLLSGLLPAGIKVTCLLDEKPSCRTIWDVPVFHPAEVDRSLFDAVVLSSDVHERQMFYQARDYGFECILLIYGAGTALKQNRADFEEIRRATAATPHCTLALYDPSWFTQCLLQSEYLNGARFACVLSDKKEPEVRALLDMPVIFRGSSTMPSFDRLVVPPRVPRETINDLQQHFGDRILALPTNPDEIELIHTFLQRRRVSSVMLDVGANVGMSLKPFAADGWRVHAFEPDSVHRRKLTKICKNHPNVSISALALSNTVTEKIPLYRSRVSGGISGLTVFHDSHYFSEYIRTTVLSIYVRENGLHEADFLKIDTEGYDLFVLQGNDWHSFRPRVVMCEFDNRKTVPLGYDFHVLAKFLVDQGYHLVVSEWEPLLEYGNQPRWGRFADYPCRLLDPEAIGNILAFRDGTDYSTFKAQIKMASC